MLGIVISWIRSLRKQKYKLESDMMSISHSVKKHAEEAKSQKVADEEKDQEEAPLAASPASAHASTPAFSILSENQTYLT